MPKIKKKSLPKMKVQLLLLVLFLLSAFSFVHFYKQTLNKKILSSESPQTYVEQKNPATLVAWQDSLHCQQQKPLSTKEWKTFHDATFLYPAHWETSTDSHAFQHGDLIGLSSTETNGESFPGGGGTKTNGAYFVISQPFTSNEPTLSAWMERNINEETLRTHNLSFELKNDLSLGNKKGIGISCAANCSNQIFTMVGDKIIGLTYTVRKEYPSNKQDIPMNELCSILASMKFTP
jgi:hypothetical protein